MKNPENGRLEKLEALIEKGFAEVRAELMELRRQIEVKDTQIAALLERVREANVITIRAVVSGNDK